MTDSRAQSQEAKELSAEDVESPKVAAQPGGWVGPQTAGRASAADQDHPGGVQEWARAWAQRFPAWSDEQWRQANAALGYRLAEGSAEAARKRAA